MVARGKVYGALRDAPARPVRQGGCVEEPRHLHVELEFEVGSDPIRGRLGLTSRTLRDFQGWIELAAALETLMSASREERAATAEPQ